MLLPAPGGPMLEQLDALGAFHTATGFAAIGFGAAVFPLRKGTRLHKRVGLAYVTSMLLLNGTAFLIYDLFGGFGPFHAAAVGSLATLLAGLWPLLRRRPGWIVRHAHLMCWSYVGLLAAFVAEITGRVPGWDFGWSVGLSSLAVIAIGGAILQIRIRPTLRPFLPRPLVTP